MTTVALRRSASSGADPYDHCVRITRAKAANFYFGIRVMGPEKRRAMCAVYAFARAVDDIGDGDLGPTAKRAGLATLRSSLGTLDDATDPVLAALGDARRRFGLPDAALHDLIDGVEMDLTQTRYEHFEELLPYCRRVAGSIGRLCVAIFGARNMPLALELGDDLGVALQLTNILRDVREDLTLGRIYLPADERTQFGCGDLTDCDEESIAALARFQAARNREWFERGSELFGQLDRRSASCVAAMSGIYAAVLDRIERDPARIMRERVSLAAWEKAWVTGRSLVAPPRR